MSAAGESARSIAVELALLFLRELEPLVAEDPERLVSTEAVLSFAAVRRADLDSFVEGRKVIAVAKHPFKGGKKSDFKRLHKARDEVWEFRSRNPQPGIRILGRFAAKDIFIAFRWSERRELGGPHSRAWRNAMVGCKTDWRHLFPAYNPFTGSDLYGYITNIILV